MVYKQVRSLCQYAGVEIDPYGEINGAGKLNRQERIKTSELLKSPNNRRKTKNNTYINDMCLVSNLRIKLEMEEFPEETTDKMPETWTFIVEYQVDGAKIADVRKSRRAD